MKLALFDFDGTVTTRETMPDFVRRAVPPLRRALGVPAFALMFAGYRMGLVAGTTIRNAVTAFGFRGVPVARVRAAGRHFATEYIPTVLRPEAGMDQQDGRHRGDARPTERFPFRRCLRHRAPSLSRSRSWERHRDLRWVPRRRSAQNNCPCGDGAHDGTKREVSSCSSRARPKPSQQQATSKRLRSSSANTPWPRMRVRKSLS